MTLATSTGAFVSTISNLRNRALQEAMKLMGDPRFMRLMNTPQAQRVMMLAFQLPGLVEGALAAQGKKFARRFKLATREDVERMSATIRDLERELTRLQQAQRARKD